MGCVTPTMMLVTGDMEATTEALFHMRLNSFSFSFFLGPLELDSPGI
ncbi:hypothetical protein RSAG8_09157, partial [Rhizoctonia solani AG-8 WAC10335]